MFRHKLCRITVFTERFEIHAIQRVTFEFINLPSMSSVFPFGQLLTKAFPQGSCPLPLATPTAVCDTLTSVLLL